MPTQKHWGWRKMQKELNLQEEIKKIIAPYKEESGSLISVLQALQNKYKYLFPEALAVMARELKLSEHEIYGVATFYAQFRFTKPGEHLVKVCLGTACHVRNGERILEAVERELGIFHGETTEDHAFSLERVSCMGCCALAPVMVVDKDVYGRTTPPKVNDIISKYRTKTTTREA